MAPCTSTLLAKVVSAPAETPGSPGQQVLLRWTVANIGTQSWPDGVKLRIVAGGESSSEDLRCPALPCGMTLELGTVVTMPETPGVHRHMFELAAPDDVMLAGGLLEAMLRVESGMRPHPLSGVRPGDHTRSFLSRTVEEAGHVTPAPVFRDRCEDWVVVQDTFMPAGIQGHFGGAAETSVVFKVNGQTKSVAVGPDLPAATSLAEYLRYHEGLTGTKIACGEGGCGACTVVLKTIDGEIRNVNACLRPLFSLDGTEVTTIEGLGSTTGGLHKLQETMAKCDASQCGMCTPGMVMSLYGHLCKGSTATGAEVESWIQGNLCRCTGYRPIYKAIHEIVGDDDVRTSCCEKASVPTAKVAPRRFVAADSSTTWINCANMSDIFVALKAYEGKPHRLVVGNTSQGVAKYYPPHPNDHPKIYMNISGIPELELVSTSKHSVTFGAAVTLSNVIKKLEELSATIPGFQAAVKHLKLVAHPQVRDVSSWAGNVMVAKTHPDFPSDVCLLLTTYKAILSLFDGTTTVKTPIEDFLGGSGLSPGQIILHVDIPFPSQQAFVRSFKIMRRHMNAHAELNAGFHLTFNTDHTIASFHAVIGNLSPGPRICHMTSRTVIGKALSLDTLKAILPTFRGEAKASPPSMADPPFLVVDATYRESLAASLLYKAWLGAMVTRLGEDVVPPNIRSASLDYQRPASTGKQVFEVSESEAPVGHPTAKLEAAIQASGQAKFTGDMPWPPGTVFAQAVATTHLGVIKSIDAAAALEVDGVVGFISADTVEEIGANNSINGTPQYIFAAGAMKHVGQIAGLICATSPAAAAAAAALVSISWSAGQTAPGELQQVLPDENPVSIPAELQQTGARTITGGLTSSGQKHFYMETQVTFAVPDGTGGLTVNCATQCFDKTQQQLASTLNKPMSKITLQNVRIGGAFGGKAMNHAGVAAAACVAALKLNRPVLFQLDRNNDFLALGARAPCDAEWSVQVRDDGRIVGLRNQVICDAGFDKSGSFPATSLSAYDISGAELSTLPKVTPKPLGTIMRAPGKFQGCVIMEAIIEQVARELGVDPTIVQDVNLLKDEGVRQLWSNLRASYDSARRDADAFNTAHRWRKRGVYLAPLQYMQGGGFGEKALVTVYADGSVAIDTSGLEQGQGLNTKVAQAATMIFKQRVASDFEMDLLEFVLPKSTAHFSWSHVTPSWGSATSESCVSATMKACSAICEQLSAFKSKGNWKEIVTAASGSGAVLSAMGEHLASEGAEGYSLPVAALVVAEIDVLTGETQILRAEVQQDTGKSLNPAIDIGQIEGCFVMALGYCLMEEQVHSDVDHRLVNNGTWDYKIPSGLDIPIEMNVTLPKSTNNAAGNVLGSKATGEPALCVSGVTFFAVKDAILAARREVGLSGHFRMNLPASPSAIQQACATVI